MASTTLGWLYALVVKGITQRTTCRRIAGSARLHASKIRADHGFAHDRLYKRAEPAIEAMAARTIAIVWSLSGRRGVLAGRPRFQSCHIGPRHTVFMAIQTFNSR